MQCPNTKRGADIEGSSINNVMNTWQPQAVVAATKKKTLIPFFFFSRPFSLFFTFSLLLALPYSLTTASLFLAQKPNRTPYVISPTKKTLYYFLILFNL